MSNLTIAQLKELLRKKTIEAESYKQEVIDKTASENKYKSVADRVDAMTNHKAFKAERARHTVTNNNYLFLRNLINESGFSNWLFRQCNLKNIKNYNILKLKKRFIK